MDNLQPDDKVLGVRHRRKQTDPISCPVCGITVRPADMEHHYAIEIDRLHKLQNPGSRSAKRVLTPAKDAIAGCSTSSGSSGSTAANVAGFGSAVDAIDPKECWITYQRIKNNRQARLKVKSRKRKSDDPICPVCNESSTEDINVHVEKCLRLTESVSAADRNGNGMAVGGESDDDDESIDVEADTFEEYEWAGQTRVRVSSLLEGGYASVGMGTHIQNAAQADDDEDLIVDGDDTQVFGETQYSEHDVIIPSAATNKEQNENLYLRKLVVGSDLPANNHRRAGPSSSQDDQHALDPPDSQPNSNVEPTAVQLTQDSKDQIIESLKAKIREFETLRTNNKCKCLICMDEFRVPVVSICCWHVHCEECWLRTLGARKLCPQCNMITSPTDLRRIYM